MGKKKNRHKNRNKRKRNRHTKEEKLIMENPFTQDIPVFVYGTLKADGSNHNLISGKHAGASFIGSAITSEAKWAMVSFFKYPGVRGDKKNRIWGELYMVDKICLEEIDTLENNGKLFQREKIKVTLTEDDSEWDAWMYVMLPNKLGPQDDPDKFDQPGVSQYDYSDDDDTSVDHWEPAPAAASTGETEIEVDLSELEVDPRAPRRFRKVVDREKMKVYYVTSQEGEVVQTLTIDPPKKKEESKPAATTIASASSASSGFNGPKPTESTLDYAHRIIAEKKLAEDAAKARTDANRYPLTRVATTTESFKLGAGVTTVPVPLVVTSKSDVPVWENPHHPEFAKYHPNAPASFYGRELGHGGVPERTLADEQRDNKKLYQDAAKNWSDAVKAAVESVAGEASLADSTAGDTDALTLAQQQLDESPSRRWVGHDLDDDDKDVIIYGC